MKPPPLPSHNHQPTPELIARTIRQAIVRGEYRAKQPLRQDIIAAELGVSKIPLREALVQLRAEGLVEFLPNRGAVVSGLSPAEVDEVFTMRSALEVKALERSVPKLRPADFIRAEAVLAIIEAEEDRAKWSELNWEFHRTMYQAAGMPRLLSAIEALHNNAARGLVIYLDRLSAQDVSQAEHRRILAACRAGDLAAAARELEAHLSRASRRLMTFLTPAETGEETGGK
ncbi:MAG: GntR family transcriptional regulator [Pseudomonadota bacterium]